MRKILIVSLLCICSLLYAGSLNTITDSSKQSNEINDNFINLDLNKQSAMFTVLTDTPTLNDLQPNQVKLHTATGVYHIYIRIGNDLIMFTGTKVN
jgi:hypothetical protein